MIELIHQYHQYHQIYQWSCLLHKHMQAMEDFCHKAWLRNDRRAYEAGYARKIKDYNKNSSFINKNLYEANCYYSHLLRYAHSHSGVNHRIFEQYKNIIYGIWESIDTEALGAFQIANFPKQKYAPVFHLVELHKDRHSKQFRQSIKKTKPKDSRGKQKSRRRVNKARV